MDLLDAIKGLKTHRDRLAAENAWERPDALSDIMTKMSVYNSYLGDHLSRLEAIYLRKRAKIYKQQVEGGNSATGADNESRNATIDERMAYEEVKQLHKDTQSSITVMQTHLKVLTAQANNQM